MILEAKDLNQQGVALMKAGNIEKAKEKFEKAIDVEPMVMDSYKNYGDLYMSIKDYKEAKNYYKKALLIEKSGPVYFQYGNACFMNDEPHEGLEYYNLALSAGFDSDEMMFFMGMAHEHMNDLQIALRYYQKAINKNPSRPDYKVKKIGALINLNLLEDAEKATDELILSDPELYDGYHIKTTLLFQKEAYEEAASFAKEAVDRFPEDVDLLCDYVRAVIMTQNHELAIELIENAKRMKYYEDAKAVLLYMEAQVYAEQANMDKAIECCKDSVALEGEDEFYSEVRFMLVNLYVAKKDYENGYEAASVLIEEHAVDQYYFAALYYRPLCLKNMGKTGESIKFYEEAISLYRLATLKNPEAIDAYLYRAMCLKDIEKYDEALEMLDLIESLTEQLAEIHTIRAEIYKITGKETLVNEELEKAYAIKPELKQVFGESGE